MWPQSSTREPWQLQYLKSLLLEMLFVTTWSVFQNQVTYRYIDILQYLLLQCNTIWPIENINILHILQYAIHCNVVLVVVLFLAD